MLSDNIRSYRKKNNLSQDELAEKIGVSRQSVSFWETGQTQPTLDNIISLSKIFNISSDELLGNTESINIMQNEDTVSTIKKKKNKIQWFVIIGIIIAVIICAIIILLMFSENNSSTKVASNSDDKSNSVIQSDTLYDNSISDENSKDNSSLTISAVSDSQSANSPDKSENSTSANSEVTFDLFSYCKNFAIEKGELNGDYCIYQQPATKYGGYNNEYFSISYWSDSNMVEFCLHCPLDETLSHNFYLRMRGGYNKKYEFLSSKYFRDTGESLREATGDIDPAVFSDSYPISCDEYYGSFEGQDQFMEESRVGICNLIKLLKEFVRVENMECDFTDFGFKNF